MSSVTGTVPRKSIHKRLVAVEKIEQVAGTVDVTASEVHVGVTFTLTSGTGKTFTLPIDSAETGILIGHGGKVVQGGAGAVTFATAGTLLNNAATAKTNGSDAVTYWEKVAANTYRIWGDLAAS